jgi:uncharacterized cupredoxin-like copper-binding protein
MRLYPVVIGLVVALLGVSVALAPSVQAADVSRTLITRQGFHFDTYPSTEKNLTVTVGDVIQLRIQSQEPGTTTHTFTAPHFPSAANQLGSGTTLNVSMTPGRTFFWNYTVTSQDLGKWQFYCSTPGHSIGTVPNRAGMVGNITVQAAPAQPVDTLLIVGGVAAGVIVVAAVAAVMMRRRAKPPTTPPTQ